MKNIILLVLVLMAFITKSALANNPVQLYKNYKFGMSKLDLQKNTNVYDCSEVIEKGALCLDGEKFFEMEVLLGFRFFDDKLVSVVLFSEFTEEKYMKLLNALKSKFQIIQLVSGNEKIDTLIQFKKMIKLQFLKT
ncbi:hypothetical protein [Nitrosomonas sp. Nm34]|uniref:hypothetical protein n=1 Tax=Nitrosomonas sp. Nm34 TaxID=1881055 RepID=UPI0008E4E6D0|nr:hypothetical protein [Nitrosomonas sp. Nm34]SFI39671.1 hypothetical protein SAMN05428978_100857 [Nitrosomonas sp. Nm34]